MTIMNNSLIELLYSQQETQSKTSKTLATIQQTQLENLNDSSIEDISTFNGTQGLFWFDIKVRKLDQWCVLIHIWGQSNMDLSMSKVEDMYSDMFRSNRVTIETQVTSTSEKIPTH